MYIMDAVDALEALDITPTESAIYLFLLQNGPSYGSQLQIALELQKVPVYRALKALKAKDYIEALGETRNQRFAARPVQTLLDAYDAKAKQLASAKQELESLITTLASHQNNLYKQNRIKIYEGKEGFRLWDEARIGKDVDIIGHRIVHGGDLPPFIEFNEFFLYIRRIHQRNQQMLDLDLVVRAPCA